MFDSFSEAIGFVLLAIIILIVNLAFLALSVWVIVKVLQGTGVL